MEYKQTNSIDPVCINGNGNIDDVTAKVCRTNPTRTRTFSSNTTTAIEFLVEPRIEATHIVNDRDEVECIFPYSFDGRNYTECLVFGIEGFTQPVFRCPMRTIKDRGTNYLSNVTINPGGFVGHHID